MTREEILDAVKEASSLCHRFLGESETSFDLVSTVDTLGIPVLYRPLDNMWGGAVTVGDKNGILIKSNLPRYLQRFTLAHEIGHILLGHKNQFDDQVGLNQRATGRTDRPIEEIAADTFASELLAPRKLIKRNAKRQGWSKKKLQEPKFIYQLSLRLGISFEATCWALVDHGLLERDQGNNYTTKDGLLKETKSSLTPFSVPRHPHADVWTLSEVDAGIQLEADEEDIFILELEERSSSGYRWNIKDENSNAKIALDDDEIGEKYGAPSTRIFALKFNSPGDHTLTLSHQRPWNGEKIDELRFMIDTNGREEEGLPRKIKQTALTGAKA